MKVPSSAAKAVILGLLLVNFTSLCFGALEVGFYRGKCGVADVESIVRGVVIARFSSDPTIVAALLRMQFHDCFVNGCDASLLLDGPFSEKTAPPNFSVRGFDIIDQAKTAIENVCPGVVSCADIISLATRDAVFLSGGGRYEVQTGRRDGLVSLAANVDLPGPSISVTDAIAAFAKKGLTATDMVLLLGGHTVGITHCSLISDRLYNYQNTGGPDPDMDLALVSILRSTCPQNAAVDNAVALDQMSPLVVDNSFYKQLLMRRGILPIDQALALDSSTKFTVISLANGVKFPAGFGEAMVKLGAVEVLTGTQGEIRRTCAAINGP
ncbi:PREDICTED: peroxidase 57-like [Nelumbo nucifera]|uniref:Peroxidase n=2 Tax=Nelumbo nucifera TaxID=4432 RepID=A0A822ZRT4_NELNU|nr:PREDICTED: peroxidase 57-like [Nelumbo nucifera]DAD47583.1 TPA_asm: hypothetical protein HUJ06_017520 [Nelumbo nucifera]